MPVIVHIPQMMRKHADGKNTIEVNGSNVKEAIDDLGSKFPELMGRICENGKLRPHINIILNDEDIRFLDNQQSAIKDGDILSINPVISGG